ncbi:MAG: hypothetical protein ABW275_04175 [Hansschlegelia sp.]
MSSFVLSGLIADLALLILAAEAVFLWAYRRRTGRGPRLAELWPFLTAGAGLVLALRAALVGAPWYFVAAGLALSGVAHAVDIGRRFRT